MKTRTNEGSTLLFDGKIDFVFINIFTVITHIPRKKKLEHANMWLKNAASNTFTWPVVRRILKSWITRDTMAHLRHASIVSTRPAGQKGLFAHFWHTLAWVLAQTPKVVPDSQKRIETTATRSMDVDGWIQIISLGDHDIDVRCVPRKTSYTEHVPIASRLHEALKMEQFPRMSGSRCYIY